ncbi:hypothetical protein Vafri_4028 [Volvox africanus]|uniref:F-box domain-containing protein n=1 Tax=Volvox africanus TaxID=51714 RepID=A0A8J4ASR7_9CHLO|nr:hypothetical protein Vafri_4028 [Volvox africanus]
MRTSYLVLAWWTHREHNTRAMRELQMLFERAFRKDADKGVQLAMFEDLQTALHQAERMGRLDRTLDQLIAAAVRVLPKQKRTLVVTAQKRAAVQMRRSARRGDGMEGNSETGPDDDGTHNLAALDDLPVEVVEAIFGHLGPVELARCTCVSRCHRTVQVLAGFIAWRRHSLARIIWANIPRHSVHCSAQPAHYECIRLPRLPASSRRAASRSQTVVRPGAGAQRPGVAEFKCFAVHGSISRGSAKISEG